MLSSILRLFSNLSQHSAHESIESTILKITGLSSFNYQVAFFLTCHSLQLKSAPVYYNWMNM